MRFSSFEQSRAFLEQNHPILYLYGNDTTDSDAKAAKVRIAYSRERDDRNKDPTEAKWICHYVSMALTIVTPADRPRSVIV